jgi:hypothetical protein
MQKADHKFHRDRRERIENDSKQSDESNYFWRGPSNTPIYIPRKKKKK